MAKNGLEVLKEENGIILGMIGDEYVVALRPYKGGNPYLFPHYFKDEDDAIFDYGRRLMFEY